MSSSACCLSRHTPSPDGVAPRPAVASPPPFKLNSKSQDLLPSSWSSGSGLSKAEDAAAIQAIFEEDKSDQGSELDKAVSKKASSTFTAVKNRLKKHLSRDSGITNSKRHSRASVGTSEEEIERRAELRRIRHKRIQEELSQEGVYDDDAKSLSTVDAPVAPNISAIQKRASWTPGDPSPLPDFALPALTPPEPPPLKLNIRPVTIFNQKGPMLEALYYGLMSPQTPTTKAQAEAYFTEWSNTMINSSTARSRRHSSPATSWPELKMEEPDVHRSPRKRSSLPPVPPAPVIQPQRLPSVVDPGKSSWRLSFSADNRGDQLRKLSQGTNILSLLNPDKLSEDPQPMRKWLHSQGLRSPSQTVAKSEEVSNIECSASHTQTRNSNQDFGGVDGGGDSAATLHLHEMEISQRLASNGLQSSCSSPQLSSAGSRTHQRGVSSISGISRTTYKSRVRHLQNTTDSLPLSERIPETWGNILENGNNIQDSTSSFYPSANNSIQPSPKSSVFNLFSLMAGSKSKTDATESKGKSVWSLDHLPDMEPPSSSFMSPASPRTPLSRASFPIASASSSSLPLPFAGYHRRPTADTNSTAISETESFREREAELSAVRARFAAAEARRSPSTPRSSKFREEFVFTSAPVESMPSKPSAFSRLARFAARSFDGPFERKTGIPLTPMTPTFEPDELQYHHRSKHAKGALNPVASPLEDSSVMGLWGNAVKRNADPKAKDIASNLHIPGKKDGHDMRKKSHVSNLSKDKKKFALKGLGWGVGDKDSGGESEPDPEDDWEAELARVAQKAKGRSRNIVKKPSGPDRRYPASWAKFPSHNRHERTSSADGKDRVQVKDFATDGSEFLDHGKRTLREKIQTRIVAELDKQAAAEVQNNTEGTFGRRSSMRPAGDLEFPELEVLPLQNVSLMSNEEIAEHVEEVLKEEELDRKEEELEAIFGLVKKASPKPEAQPGIIKGGTVRSAPKRSGTIKVSRLGTTTADKTDTNPAAAASTAAPVKRGPTARRGPVARKPGDQLSPSVPKAAPKIAPPVVMPGRGAAVKAFDIIDGNMDHCDEESATPQLSNSKLNDRKISIADPRFYDDCVVNTTPGPEREFYCDEGERLDEVSPRGSKNSKYRTWSGRDWDKYRYSDKSRRSLGALMLRKSTDEMRNELKRAEVVERENALRAAEEAWGGQ